MHYLKFGTIDLKKRTSQIKSKAYIRQKVVALVLLIFLLFSLSANSNQLSLEKIEKKDGLSSNAIYGVIKDKNNLIWIYTINGLNRYDGYEIKNYLFDTNKKNSIASNLIHTAYEDSSGKLWFGTQGGLSRYNSTFDNFENYFYNEYNEASICHDTVYSIIEYKGILWLGTKNGLCSFNPTTKQFKRFHRNRSNNLESHIVSLSIVEGKLWVGTKASIEVFYIKNSDAFLLPNFVGNKYGINIPNARTIIDDGSNIWAGGLQNLLYRLNKSNKSYSHIKLTDAVNKNTSIKIRQILDKGDSIWVGTYDSGIFEIQKKDSKTRQFSYSSSVSSGLNSNTILSLYKDNDSNTWIGTSAGVGVLFDRYKAFIEHSHQADNTQSLINNDVYPIFQDSQDNIWIGTFGGGLSSYHPKTQKFHHQKKLGSIINKLSIYDIEEHQKNQIWLGTFGDGVYLYDYSQNKILEHLKANPKTHNSISSNFVISLVKDNSGTLWIGSNDSGISAYNTITKQYKHYRPEKGNSNSISYDRIFSMLIDSQEILWIGTGGGGLNRYNPKSDSFERIKLSDEENSQSLIQSLYEDSEGKLWIGTYSNDVYYFEPKSESISKVKALSNLNLTIGSILEGNNKDYWLSTNRGLINYDSSLESITIFNSGNNILSSEFHFSSGLKDKQGNIFFGSSNGILEFNPNKVTTNDRKPKIIFTGFKLFNKQISLDDINNGYPLTKSIQDSSLIQLKHTDSMISFEFSALNYESPEKNQYSYKMEGYDKQWIGTDSKLRQATYTNLPDGEYTFRVKASNNRGVWNNEGISINVVVSPPIWRTWWAFMIYGLIVLGSILWFIRYRTQAAIARSRELELEVASRTKDIATQKNVIESLLERKNELFANISHEFRTPLTLILGPLEKELKALDLPKNPKHLQMIQRNATRLLGMVEQILKLTELKKEDTVNKVPHAVNPALEAIVESFSSLAESKKIALSLSLDTDANVIAANDALEVMVGNLVSNAIKYTSEGGKVSIESKLIDESAQIQVTDTGVGMTQAEQDDVFERFVRLDKTSDIAGTGIGLSIVKELMLAHDGKIQVESVEGQGSTFTLTLPTTEQAALADTHSIKSIEHLTQAEASASEVTQASQDTLTDTQQELVLIIDDNPDMRDYISEVLAPNYHCITADRGEAGIELAKAQVPDLIVCDIMMPGIDGYEVAKRLRDDIITSHIPLVLLTAKGDKESRIQGWNENIDDYMTKPFDEKELKARVSNIIDIRNILRANNYSFTPLIKAKKVAHNLTEVEHEFIEKLKRVIEENYINPNFLRPQLAKKMALSERQLQRKVKALINQNSMDMLRDFRIMKASKLLKKGLRVNEVAKQCGFNSPTHFSTCFKAKYGVSPKEFGGKRE